MKVVIIEDELPSARRLERLLMDYEVEIVAHLSSIKATVTWFSKNAQPDLIFLDVQLSDGLCFEIFNQVNITSKIIFTTAFSNYTIQAFDYNSLSYLLKPVAKEKLATAILKAQKSIQKEEDLLEFKSLVSSFTNKVYKTSFTVRVGNKIKIIQTSAINCFYSFENATYLKSGKNNYIIQHALTYLENDLDPNLFFRVNRTYIIHKKSIKEITAHSNSRLKVTLTIDGVSEIVVSRERVKEFKQWIG